MDGHESNKSMSDFFVVLAGLALIIGGIRGTRFVAGISSRVKVSSLYGRLWLVGGGIVLAMGGLAGLLQTSGSQFWFMPSTTALPRIRCFFFDSFQIYVGTVVAVGGAFLCAMYKKRQEWKMVWLFLAFVAGGAIFAYDGVWDIVHVCFAR
jgi:hypothetical protein